jgi:hypothetical protein
MSRIWD